MNAQGDFVVAWNDSVVYEYEHEEDGHEDEEGEFEAEEILAVRYNASGILQ